MRPKNILYFFLFTCFPFLIHAEVNDLNDDCSTPTFLELDVNSVIQSFSFTQTSGTLDSISQSECSHNFTTDFWYFFIAQGNSYKLEASSKIIVYRNSCQNLELITCNDYDRISTNLGDTILIRTNRYSFNLDIISNTQNDSCHTAIFLKKDTTYFASFLGAGAEGDQCNNITFSDIWFTFKPSTTRSAILLSKDLTDYGYGFITLYTNSCEDLELKSCFRIDIGNSPDIEYLLFESLVPDSTYTIRLSFELFTHLKLTHKPLIENFDIGNSQNISIEDSLSLNQTLLSELQPQAWYSFISDTSHLEFNPFYTEFEIFHYNENNDLKKIHHGNNKIILSGFTFGKEYFIKVRPKWRSETNLKISKQISPLAHNDEWINSEAIEIGMGIDTCIENIVNLNAHSSKQLYQEDICDEYYTNSYEESKDIWVSFIPLDSLITISGSSDFIDYELFDSVSNDYHCLIEKARLGEAKTIRNLIPGKKYYLRFKMDLYNGSFCLMKTIREPNDDFQNADSLIINEGLSREIIDSFWLGVNTYESLANFETCYNFRFDSWYFFVPNNDSVVLFLSRSFGFEIHHQTNDSLKCLDYFNDSNNLITGLIPGDKYFVRILESKGTPIRKHKIGLHEVLSEIPNQKIETATLLQTNSHLVDSISYNCQLTPSQTKSAWFKFLAKSDQQQVFIKPATSDLSDFDGVQVFKMNNDSSLVEVFSSYLHNLFFPVKLGFYNPQHYYTNLYDLDIGETYFIKVISEVDLDDQFFTESQANISIRILPKTPQNNNWNFAENIPISTFPSTNFYRGDATMTFPITNFSEQLCTSSSWPGFAYYILPEAWYKFTPTRSQISIQIQNKTEDDGIAYDFKYHVFQRNDNGLLDLVGCYFAFDTIYNTTLPYGQNETFIQAKIELLPTYIYPILFDIGVTMGNSVSLNEEEGNTFQLFPNPVNDILEIQNSKLIREIKIFDSGGRLIDQKINLNAYSNKLNIEYLDSGIYFISIATENQILSTKFLKL